MIIYYIGNNEDTSLSFGINMYVPNVQGATIPMYACHNRLALRAERIIIMRIPVETRMATIKGERVRWYTVGNLIIKTKPFLKEKSMTLIIRPLYGKGNVKRKRIFTLVNIPGFVKRRDIVADLDVINDTNVGITVTLTNLCTVNLKYNIKENILDVDYTLVNGSETKHAVAYYENNNYYVNADGKRYCYDETKNEWVCV